MTSVTEREMGLATTHDQKEVMMKEYTIKSEHMTAKILNYGGILNVLEVKDKNNGKSVTIFPNFAKIILFPPLLNPELPSD